MDMLDPWAEARTFGDLCELGAQFFEGKVDHFNGYGGPEVETIKLAPLLAECNRAGFLTTSSQPGKRRSKYGAQRAYVQGFAREDLAMRLYCLGLESDLISLAVPVATEDWRYIRLPVTLDGEHPFTWCGAFGGLETLDHYAEQLHPGALIELAGTYEVEIVDPRWGRNSYLWSRLLEAVRGAPSQCSALCSEGTANGVHEFIY